MMMMREMNLFTLSMLSNSVDIYDILTCWSSSAASFSATMWARSRRESARAAWDAAGGVGIHIYICHRARKNGLDWGAEMHSPN